MNFLGLIQLVTLHRTKLQTVVFIYKHRQIGYEYDFVFFLLRLYLNNSRYYVIFREAKAYNLIICRVPWLSTRTLFTTYHLQFNPTSLTECVFFYEDMKDS